jgi:hypothetical protein
MPYERASDNGYEMEIGWESNGNEIHNRGNCNWTWFLTAESAF